MLRHSLKTLALFLEALLVFAFANGLFAQTRPRSTGAANIDLLRVRWRADSILSAYQTVAPQAAPQGQTISQTGLLPLFVIDMNIDTSMVDGDAVPSSSPQFNHNGVNDVMDQTWTTLKPAGFNAIRFPVFLEDPKSPVRLANLCLWAKSNGVTLIPVLEGTADTRNNGSALADALTAFITNVISRLRGGDGSSLASYSQISFYQLERPMNHTGLYPKLSVRSAQQLLVAASAALRQSETQALQGTGIQATPISIGASFDYELIQQKAIAGIPLDPGAEQRAQSSLKEFLKGFKSPNIEGINVEWFPRSISSGDVDHFVALLKVLKESFPDHQFTLTTGFSSAFNTPDQALQFYAAAISSLGGFRASDGVDSKFVGIVLQQAFKGTNADTPAPASAGDPSQWKWSDRAQQLSAMWARGKASAVMAWWLNKVEDNMGLLAMQPNATGAESVTPLPTLQALQEISSTLTQATQQVQVPPNVPAATDPASQAAPAMTTAGLMPATSGAPATQGYVPGAQPSGQTAASPFQQLMFTLLQQFTEQIAAKLTAKIGGPNQQGGYANPAYSGVSPAVPSVSATPPSNVAQPGRSPFANTVWIGPSDINISTTSPAAGQSVVVTAQLHNQSSDQDVSGVTVELVNPANPAAASQSAQGGVSVPRSGVAPVQLTWTPDATSVGQVQLLLQALDSGGQIITSVAIPGITIPAPSNSASAGSAGSPTNVGSSTNPTLPNNPGSSTTPGGSTTGPASAPTAQLTVNGFGLADPSASTTGQIPQLQAQVSNPSQVPTQSGQAQLFLDGTPQQMQVIGSVLPSGTLTLQFQAFQAGVGQHNLQLVVTTADGVSASATFTANVTAVGTASTDTSTPPNSQSSSSGSARSVRPRAVRAVVTTNFQIANVQSTSSLPRKVMVATTPSSTTPAAKPQRQSPAVPPASGAATRTLTPRSSVRTMTPASIPAATPPGATQTSAASRVPAIRTLTPATATVVPRSNGSTGQSSPAAATGSLPASTTPATRTVAAKINPGVTPSFRQGGTPGVLDLAISPQDVHLAPVPPRAGQIVTFTAAIRNAGTAPAQQASVVFILLANGQRLASSQPMPFNVPARGVYQARWSTPVRAVAGQQIVVSVTANGDSNPANNQVVVPFSVAVAPPKAPLKTR